MSKTYFSVGTSLEGYLAGPNGGPKNPLGDGGTGIHQWLFNQQAFRRHLQLGDDGETGKDNDIVASIMERTGANIMGKRMFEEGEFNWPEDAPFHTPVYVLTHEKRAPWERKGGTTFYFINDGLGRALELARKAAGKKDIRISGGANVIQQCLTAGVVDEFYLHMAPVFLGTGVPLFTGLDNKKFGVELIEVISSPPLVVHMQYKVKLNR